MKESDLASIVVEYFEKLGYTSYKEVSSYGIGGCARTDCYFKKYNESISVEVKTSLNMKVLSQATEWTEHANKSYIAIPKPKKREYKIRNFVYDMCKNYLKIGVIEVDLKNKSIKTKLEANFNEKIKEPPLFEEQKQSEAGNDKNEFHTKFKSTLNLIHDFMKDKKCYIFSDMIKEIKHHYSNDKSAAGALKKFVGGKLLPQYCLEKRKNKVFIKKI